VISSSATLEGVHAVVTGGGTGIGAAIARALAVEGARLTLIGRRAEPLQAVAEEVGALTVAADANDRAALDAALDTARARHGDVGIAVANAGAALTAPFARTSIADWHTVFGANLGTTVNLAQATLDELKRAPAGRFVAVASTAGLTGYAYCTAYAAAKHAVVGLVRSLAREVSSTAMTVNAVCPGFTDTPIADAAIANIATKTGRTVEAAHGELTRFNPQGRLVDPDEVAAAVAWLCNPSSRSVTGQTIAIDGGETM